MEPNRPQNPIAARRRNLAVALISLVAAACAEPPNPTAAVAEPPVAVPTQTTAPSSQTTGAAAAETVEPPAPRPRPAWVLRYGNDHRERFPTVSKGGRSYSDDDRKRQNERLILFWRAHEAGERSVLHVDYLRGAHGRLFYRRLVTEDGSARLVMLARQSTTTPDFPFGGNPLFWRLTDETPLTDLRFGRLRWDDRERARFAARRPPYKAEGPSLGFEFKPVDGSDRSYFPPILHSIKSE